MDPVKVLIFVGAFVILLVLGRLLSASSEVHASTLPHSQPLSGDLDHDAAVSPQPPDGRRGPSLTGAEYGFPFRMPPVTRSADGAYNRPNFTDYYFSKIDLVRGPEDPGTFLDELCLKAEDPDTGYAWEYYFTVATPAGLRRVMDEENFVSLYFTGGVVVVPRWDLSEILHTVVDEIMKSYGNKHADSGDLTGERRE